MGAARDLREPCEEAWTALVENRFVAEMADGTLPLGNFRFYIEQNLFYLPDYARMLGLAVANGRTMEQIQRFTRGLEQIVDTEIPANRHLLDEVVAMGAEDHGGSTEPGPACLAYSSFLVATAATGDANEVMAAMLPCAWSYADIAARHHEPASHPIYQKWLATFGDPQYQAYVGELLADADRWFAEANEAEMVRLRRAFRGGVRMESAFWSMASALGGWP